MTINRNNNKTNKKLGVLGGGQLGRMLYQPCIDLNISMAVLDPDPECPCASICPGFRPGSITDYNTVYNFGKDLDIITVEIENVCTEALEQLQKEGKHVFPQPEILRLIKDKRFQKQFYKENHIPTAEFVLVENKEELQKHTAFFPAFHKSATGGYDGKGVQKINSSKEINRAFDGPGVLEKAIDVEKEIAVITARNSLGQTVVYPPAEAVFHADKNMLDYLIAPANVSEKINQQAEKIALELTEKLGIVGLLAVELFLTKNGEILVNEIAPRPHNTGHHTIEGNVTSQYEQHLRAVFNLPLGSTKTILPSAVINLIGRADAEGPVSYEGLEEILKIEGVHVHLYGKKNTKPYRKMGHVTVTDHDTALLFDKIKRIKNVIRVTSLNK